jgi:hypothetical protein
MNQSNTTTEVVIEKKKWNNYLKRLDQNPKLSQEDKIRCMFNKKKKIIKNKSHQQTTMKSKTTKKNPQDPQEPPKELTDKELRHSYVASVADAYS